MTDKSDKAAGGESRQDRLKSALRENLRRRKLQARARGRTADPSHDDDPPSDEGVVGKSGGSIHGNE